MSFLKMSLNQVRSVTEALSHPEAENSISVTSTAGRGAHVVTSLLSPLVYLCDPWSKATWSSGCHGLPGPTSTTEALCQTHEAVPQRSCPPWALPEEGASGALPPKCLPLKELKLREKKEKEKIRKTGLCKQSSSPPCSTRLQKQKLPKEQAVYMGAGGSAGETQGEQWVTWPPSKEMTSRQHDIYTPPNLTPFLPLPHPRQRSSITWCHFWCSALAGHLPGCLHSYGPLSTAVLERD